MTAMRVLQRSFMTLSFILCASTGLAWAEQEAGTVIIQSRLPSGSLRQIVEAQGGAVWREYPNLDAVAAEVSPDALATIRTFLGEAVVVPDAMMAAPLPVGLFAGRDSFPADDLPGEGAPMENIPHLGARLIPDIPSFAAQYPNAYRINHSADNVVHLHRTGLTGRGVVIAVVDSGLRPGFGAFDPAGRLAGCEDLVGDGNGCISAANDGHGSMVSSVILGSAAFAFDPFRGPADGSVFLESARMHADAALDLDGDQIPESVAMIGSAPGAQIYMFRVFESRGASTRTSLILEAVERILEKKKEGLNIQVASFSLGRFTLNAGRDVMDIAQDALLAAGIVPVASAGNAGPALMTVSTPASAASVVSVGAASQAHQERIAADVGFFQAPGLGQFLRIFPGGQTAWFSSRGPNADGRMGPHVVSEGLGVFGVGLGLAPPTVSLGNGSSYAAPNVAGIAALLAEAFPQKSAQEIQSAIRRSGNPEALGDGSTPADRGAGWVDALRAREILESELSPRRVFLDPADGDPRPDGPRFVRRPPGFPAPTSIVAYNLEQAVGTPVRFGNVQEGMGRLRPGERVDLPYLVTPYHESIRVSVSDVTADAAGCEANPVFGDELRLGVHTSKTSSIGPAGEYYDLNPSPAAVHAFISTTDPDNPEASGVLPGACGGGACTFLLPTPEPGVARISISGATENGCAMSARIAVQPEFSAPAWDASAYGTIREGRAMDFAVDVPAGASDLTFELEWENDWSRYPTNDLDLWVYLPWRFFPQPVPLPFGQSLNAPEQFVITPEVLGGLFGSETPIPLPAGRWTVRIVGFQVNERRDGWAMRVYAGDRLLRAKLRPSFSGPVRE